MSSCLASPEFSTRVLYFALTLLVQVQSSSTLVSTGVDDRIKKFVIDQRKGTAGIFRDEPWFSKVEANRKVDFSKKPFTVDFSDGSPSVRGLGLIVPSPELRSASVTGKINTDGMCGKLKNAVGERRLMAWAFGKEDKKVFIMSDDDELAAALRRKREKQKYYQAKHVLGDWVSAALWESMISVALDLMAEEDDSICEWWRLNASIHGENAPWNKHMLGLSNQQLRPILDGGAPASPSVSPDGGAAATPTVSPVNTAPLSQAQINALCNHFSRCVLNSAYFLEVEPVRFALGANVLYAKRTPFMPDGKALPTRKMPDFVRDTKKIPKQHRRDISNLREYFLGCFAVISLDGKTYYQASEKEVQDDMRDREIDVSFCKTLQLSSLPDRTYQRVVNEKVRRLDMRDKKRKASRDEAPMAKASRTVTSESESSDDSGSEHGGGGMNSQDVSDVVATRFGQLIGSIPVFDVTDGNHTPSEEIVRFGQFRKFTATTSQDADKILGGPGSKGGFKKQPFPVIRTFEKPVPSAPAITDVKRLYNLGLMIGLTSNNTVMCANASKITHALGLEGVKDVTAERYLEEVQLLMDASNGVGDDEDAIDTDQDLGYVSPANSGVVRVRVICTRVHHTCTSSLRQVSFHSLNCVS